ncbi:MAG: DUF4956 domain-containing protein [Saprospiraceae bacterium]
MSIVFTVLCSIVLGILLAFTYEHTSKNVSRPNHFLQAMVLVTVVASMIIQAIGDSVARGLGMIGALSIIRFRTTVRDPRNIVFMFSAIAAGIACGVFGYLIAIIGTLGFCFTAFLLKYSSFSRKENLVGNFKIQFLNTVVEPTNLEKNVISDIKANTIKYGILKTIIGSGAKSNTITYNFEAQFRSLDSCKNMVSSLDKIPEVKVSNVTFTNEKFDQI